MCMFTWRTEWQIKKAVCFTEIKKKNNRMSSKTIKLTLTTVLVVSKKKYEKSKTQMVPIKLQMRPITMVQ